jgi:hypothetical protein
MASDLHAGSWLLPIQNPPLFFTIPQFMFPIWQVELLLEKIEFGLMLNYYDELVTIFSDLVSICHYIKITSK